MLRAHEKFGNMSEFSNFESTKKRINAVRNSNQRIVTYRHFQQLGEKLEKTKST